MVYGPGEFQKDFEVSRETCARFEGYGELLLRWSRAMNLVGRDTLQDLWRRHFLDSAQLLRWIPAGRPVIYDLGSGAGFPGLVLSLLGAGEMHLVEADQKKAAFLREAIRITGASAKLHARRAETLGSLGADVVTARAVAPLPRLLPLAAPLLGPEGICLFLKGRAVEEELTGLQCLAQIEIERFSSRSDPEGSILRITGLRAVKGPESDAGV